MFHNLNPVGSLQNYSNTVTIQKLNTFEYRNVIRYNLRILQEYFQPRIG